MVYALWWFKENLYWTEDKLIQMLFYHILLTHLWDWDTENLILFYLLYNNIVNTALHDTQNVQHLK